MLLMLVNYLIWLIVIMMEKLLKKNCRWIKKILKCVSKKMWITFLKNWYDDNKFIEYEEFGRACINKEQFLAELYFKFPFNYFHIDNSGKITFDEIEAIFKQSVSDKNKVHDSFIKIFYEYELNYNWYINFEEFSILMIKMIEWK